MSEQLESIAKQVESMIDQTGYRLLCMSEFLYLWHKDRSPVFLSIRSESILNADARLISASLCDMRPDDPLIEESAKIGRNIAESTYPDARILYYESAGDVSVRLTLPIINERVDALAFVSVMSDLIAIQDAFEESIKGKITITRNDPAISLHFWALDRTANDLGAGMKSGGVGGINIRAK